MDDKKKYSRKDSVIALIIGIALSVLMLWVMFHETDWWEFFNPWYQIIAFGIFLASVKLIISTTKDIFSKNG